MTYITLSHCTGESRGELRNYLTEVVKAEDEPTERTTGRKATTREASPQYHHHATIEPWQQIEMGMRSKERASSWRSRSTIG
jgi:hypothetical protein